MNNRNNDNQSTTLNRPCAKDSEERSEESLVKAASVLKSLANWNKEYSSLVV